MLEEYEKKEPIIYRQISNSIKNGLSHAYLFELNDNIYAYEMIMSFVKKVLSNGDDNIAKRIDDGNYPELKHIFPDGQLIRKEQLEELQKSFSTISLENEDTVIWNGKRYTIIDKENLIGEDEVTKEQVTLTTDNLIKEETQCIPVKFKMI